MLLDNILPKHILLRIQRDHPPKVAHCIHIITLAVTEMGTITVSEYDALTVVLHLFCNIMKKPKILKQALSFQRMVDTFLSHFTLSAYWSVCFFLWY